MLKEIIGTVVGVTNPQEFYFSVTPGKVAVQDIVAVDTFKIGPEGENKDVTERVWAKVSQIERINPLFPQEAAHELAFQQTSAFDTVISLSREMITAKCEVIGVDRIVGGKRTLVPLTYPLQPASSVYIPEPDDIQSLITGNIPNYRRLHVGHLRAKESFDVYIDAHAIVARHLAILAATGAGKTVTTRKILEGLVEKNYPLVIFDSHGDYIGLQDIFSDKVQIFVPNLNLSDEDPTTIIDYISGLSGQKLTPPQVELLHHLLQIFDDKDLLEKIYNSRKKYGGKDFRFDLELSHFFAIMGLAIALEDIPEDSDDWKDIEKSAKKRGIKIKVQNKGTYGAVIRALKLAGEQMKTIRNAIKMAQIKAKPLPSKDAITSIVAKGTVTLISLEGYSDAIKQSFVGKILQEFLEQRINGKIPKFLSVIEEAHNFIPSRSELAEGIVPSLPIIRRIATEGRKYGAGLILISQRPSRIDSTILSMANSYIILKIINPGDQKYVRDVVESIGEEDVQLLPDLAVGEALITGQCVRFPVLAHITQPRSRGKYEEEDFIKEFVG